MKPWLHRFFELGEIELVLDLDSQKASGSWDQAFLDRCHRRGVISHAADGRVVVADFHVRYDIWAMFEGWQDVPNEIRIKLNKWEIASYVSKKRPVVIDSQKTGKRDKTEPWSEFALLDEALALIERTPHVYLWPCNCRAMVQGCQKLEFVCLRFSNNRNLGWEISRTRAQGIIKTAHKKGLMQNISLALLPDGTIDGGICNCCSDCCFDQQLAETLEIKSQWPIHRYVALHRKDQCTACGRCTKRCPFQAFTMTKQQSDQDAPATKTVYYDASLCRGCGLCASSCPETAIEMKPLEQNPMSILTEALKS